MTDVISRPVRLPREDYDAVDEEVARGRFASADELIQTAIEQLLYPVEILDGDELDESLGPEEPRENYRDGPTVMREMIARLEAAAAAQK